MSDRGVVLMRPMRISASEDGVQALQREMLARIADKKATRKTVADLYETVLLVQLEDRASFDWGAVNRAIMTRWSISGLGFIKTLAWKRIEGRY